MSARAPRRSPTRLAMIAATAVTAQFVGGKATRDALFLANLDVTALPTMVIGAACFSIAIVLLSARLTSGRSPVRLVALAFVWSAVFLAGEWLLMPLAPSVGAVLVYLHVSGVGPLLGSGFWLIATELFDPRTAKRRFGQIAGAGTLGGLLGAALAERVGAWFDVRAMLLGLAAINLICAWQIARLAGAGLSSGPATLPPDVAPEPVRSGLRVLRQLPYLGNLAALVLLGTFGAALLDYVFKAEAVAAFGRGEGLLRFFAAFYAVTSVFGFAAQTLSSRFALERFGLAAAVSAPSLALLTGGSAALLARGLPMVMMARAGESVLRSSLFRSGYELFYTPIPVREKRAAKSIIDVGFDRLGEIAGGSVIRIVLAVAPAIAHPVILLVAVAGSGATLLVASRLNRGYVLALERSLRNRAIEIDLSDVGDMTTRSTLVHVRGDAGDGDAALPHGPGDETRVQYGAAGVLGSLDPEVQDIVHLRSADRDRVAGVLGGAGALTPALVPHVIPLLAWDPVAEDAIAALREVADRHVGQLVDALLDPDQDFAIRRRLARVLAVCTGQRAADGLVLGLGDARFEVRVRSGRALGAIRQRDATVRIDAAEILQAVQREVMVGRPVWESRRLLDRHDAIDQQSFVDEFLRDRANQSLAHVFTLLSLVLPSEPLGIAFRGLHTDDRQLRGTALEYLDGVLPPGIRGPLWPYLEDRRTVTRSERSREDILDELLRSNQSIMMNLEELKRRT